MSWARSIQFRGRDAVMQAYESREVPAFAIFAGNQLLFPCKAEDMEEGSAKLGAFLESIAADHSAGHYTLCVYEDLPANARINSKTPYDGSFNFILADYLPEGLHRGNNSGILHELMSEVKAMRVKQDELEKRLEEEEEEAEPQDAIGRIGQILENPLVQQYLPVAIGFIQALFQKNEPPAMHQVEDAPASTKVAGIQLKDPATMSADEKIREALQVLSKGDPDFPDLLYKLARIKAAKPMQYGIYVTMLKTMKV